MKTTPQPVLQISAKSLHSMQTKKPSNKKPFGPIPGSGPSIIVSPFLIASLFGLQFVSCQQMFLHIVSLSLFSPLGFLSFWDNPSLSKYPRRGFSNRVTAPCYRPDCPVTHTFDNIQLLSEILEQDCPNNLSPTKDNIPLGTLLFNSTVPQINSKFQIEALKYFFFLLKF